MQVLTATPEHDQAQERRAGTQELIAHLCAEYGFGPSKAAKTVRRWERDRDDNGWDQSLFEDWLISEAIVACRRRPLPTLLHADPTGETAARNATQQDPHGAKQAARWANKYDLIQGRRRALAS